MEDLRMFYTAQILQFKGDAIFPARHVSFAHFDDRDSTVVWVIYPGADKMMGAPETDDKIQVNLSDLEVL
jgi:hypothetical protein